MKKTLKEISKYWKLSPEIKKILKPSLSEEFFVFDAESILRRATLIFQNQCKERAKIIVKRLVQEKKEKQSNKLVCVGNKGYIWLGSYFSLKSSCNRVGRYEPLVDIVSDALFEYHILTKQPIFNLRIFIATEKEVEKIFKLTPEQIERTFAANVAKKFWENINLIK